MNLLFKVIFIFFTTWVFFWTVLFMIGFATSQDEVELINYDPNIEYISEGYYENNIIVLGYDECYYLTEGDTGDEPRDIQSDY